MKPKTLPVDESRDTASPLHSHRVVEQRDKTLVARSRKRFAVVKLESCGDVAKQGDRSATRIVENAM